MANLLVERLCQVEDVEGGGIAYEPFSGVIIRIISGRHTRAQAKSFYNMGSEDGSGFDSLMNIIDGKTTTAAKILAVWEFTAIMTFWEQGDVPGYQTPDQIQTELLGV